MDRRTETLSSFVIHEQIGKGGMASVHRAEAAARDGSRKSIALKRLLPAAAMNKDLLASFINEGRLLRYLDHPNIAATYDAGKLSGSHYIAMEFIPGRNLKELVDQCAATVNKLPTPMALSIAFQIADALDYAHNRCDEHGAPLGIIHRDVSLANAIVSATGTVKLIDFGLAKAKTTSSETDERMIKGKFSYVAPEYLQGALDARADLWALGVVMYELLTSRRLFDAPDNFETVTRVRELPIPKPSRANPRVSPQLDAIVMRALERDPAKRWQSAAELRDALAAVIAQPGNAFDAKQIANWVDWVFAQQPGGKESSAIADLFAVIDHPAPIELTPTIPEPAVPPLAPALQTSSRRGSSLPRPLPWIVAAAIAVIVIAAIALIAS
ncbi:MAG: serine/threonine-protein kinase [Kofleriaceae bacterium]